MPATVAAFTREREDGLVISDDADRLNLDRICHWLATAYWARGRDRATIERSLAGSRPYGVYTADGTQVALARVITDFATFAWIGDVIVDPAWRGKGIGTWLMRAVVDDLESRGVPRFVLATRDAHEVYRRVGFYPVRAPSTLMEIDQRASRPNPD